MTTYRRIPAARLPEWLRFDDNVDTVYALESTSGIRVLGYVYRVPSSRSWVARTVTGETPASGPIDAATRDTAARLLLDALTAPAAPETCKAGHVYAVTGRRKDGSCSECKREQARVYDRRKAAERAAAKAVTA